MDVPFNPCEIAGEHVHFVKGNILLQAFSFSNSVNRLKVFCLIECRHITGVQDIVDILYHLLVYDLSITKEECCRLIIDASHH